MTKIIVISDTHIPDRAIDLPEEIIPQIKGADMVIHAGDLVSLKVWDKLKKLCPNVHAVYGNMDPFEVRKVLSEKEVISVGKYKIGLMHGIGAPVGLVEVMAKSFKDDNVDIIIFGHSHAPFNEKKGRILFFNPGSLTDKVFSPYNSYGILEINDKIEARIEKI
ncbi:MAG: metallophosphoesterase [Candidatus Omnitrophica bacterium]|nr:metallophosphoesterase [Candidatus Omnitrophota bacterium]